MAILALEITGRSQNVTRPLREGRYPPALQIGPGHLRSGEVPSMEAAMRAGSPVVLRVYRYQGSIERCRFASHWAEGTARDPWSFAPLALGNTTPCPEDRASETGKKARKTFPYQPVASAWHCLV